MSKTYFIEPDLQAIIDECNGITRFLWKLSDTYIFELQTQFDAPELSAERYLAAHYACTPSSTPGIVRCDDHTEALLFLTLLRDRIRQNPEKPFDYEAVLEAAGRVQYEGLRSGMSNHCEDGDPEGDFPLKDGEPPYWILEALKLPDNSTVVYTANWSTLYGSHGDIPAPEGENKNSLLFYIEGGDIGSEAHVELGSEENVKEWWGVEDGSLEWFLWSQLFCHNKNLAKERMEYAYVRYDIIGAAWLTPDPDNIAALKSVLRRGDFERYYKNHCEAIAAWLDECHFRYDPEEHRTEPEKFAALIAEYRSAIASPDAWFEYINGEKS